MGHSSSSDVVYLPFGSLTGVIPVDVVQPDRKLGEFSSVIGSTYRIASDVQNQIHSAINPVTPVTRDRRPCPSGGGGI